ncbi:hypothetical protein [Leadbettera azotonutricia]|uniref:DUF5362 domain-containing protein n=1 Tax=Leadbettera azotonutricia (strain ATCC BAA-888 / DSM 13862 / ZAS-9) TaxID=545695 RepID=F5YE22_LEAAZ|nr:hypothetical protein [Leadbettera azotonutricia]AEF80459.1 conserved hypothetical protein [Leadbettera azotonutricia ZAS-9]
MSDLDNPYQSPEAAATPETPLVSQTGLTEAMLAHLKGASPWLRFIGIMGFICCGLLVLGGIVFLAMIPTMTSVWGNIPGLQSFSNVLGAAFSGSMGIYFFICAVIGFFPSRFAYAFGSKIRSYLRSGADGDLEEAFKNNKSLWKFAGIVTIISLAFIPIMIIVGIVIAVAMAI